MPEQQRVGQSGEFAPAEAAQSLRGRAEDLVNARYRVNARYPSDTMGLSVEATRRAMHELHVHEIELELQNEELRRTQCELEASRARYFDLYDLAPVGYLTIGEKGLVLEANLTVAGLLGVHRSALVMQPWTRFILPEDQDLYFRHRKRLLLGAPPQVCELRLLKKTGEAFWARLEARIALDADGAPASRTAVVDISERKRTDETLNASEARYRILFERSPDALITLTGPEWRFTAANAAATAMFGARDQRDLLARTLWQYAPARQPDGSLSQEKAAAMIAVAMRGGTHAFDWACRRVSGEAFRAAVVLTRMQTNGETLLQATVRDETVAQKNARARAQTERLASLGLLAASLGHEINNPLAYLLGNVERLAEVLPKLASAAQRCWPALRTAIGEVTLDAMLKETDTTLEPATLQRASEQARDALDGAQRIALISKTLTKFARVDQVDLCPVDLNHALESAIAMAFNEMRFRCKLVKDLRPLPPVRATDGQLSQVFLNLLLNASHSLNAGEPESNTITVRTWALDGQVLAEVSDTGMGIAPEHIARIFDPFFSTKPLGTGTGLGLSICRSIVVELGGDIEVESELGKGARFVVRLPAWSGVLTMPSTRASSDIPEPIAPRGRILVVDDEPKLLKLITRMLAEHEVVAVDTAQAAQAAVERDQAFDLILCDVMMPEVTGVELHRWLAQHHPALADRTVFMTGGAFLPGTVDYLANSGASRIDKPFDASKLRGIVSERLRLQRER
jgi:two-component system, cell cycle sensor histidine kinase and response regulator CckA